MSKRRGIGRSFRSDDLRDAYRRACRNGWTSDLDGRGHVVMTSPDGGTKVRLSCTAFGGPATRAKVAELRRKGAFGRDGQPARMGRADRRATLRDRRRPVK